MNKLPRSKITDKVVQELGNELLIYDLKTNQAYCLSETAAKIFNACGNEKTFEYLERQYRYTKDLVHLTLEMLATSNLLENYPGNHFAGLSRRAVIWKVGLATWAALPMIAGIIAPPAARAASNIDTTSDPNNCGGLSVFCPGRPNASPNCRSSTCGFTCNSGFANCNGISGDGCEANLSNDAGNCGGCGVFCPARANALGTCDSGVCSFTCNDGFANCNGSAGDGCEANLNTSSSNCGACGRICTNGTSCVSGSCV